MFQSLSNRRVLGASLIHNQIDQNMVESGCMVLIPSAFLNPDEVTQYAYQNLKPPHLRVLEPYEGHHVQRGVVAQNLDLSY